MIIFNKKNFVFFNPALIKLQQLVRPPLSKQVQFIFRKGNALSFRDVLIDVRSRGVYSLIIDTRPESLPKILNAVGGAQILAVKNFPRIPKLSSSHISHLFFLSFYRFCKRK